MCVCAHRIAWFSIVFHFFHMHKMRSRSSYCIVFHRFPFLPHTQSALVLIVLHRFSSFFISSTYIKCVHAHRFSSFFIYFISSSWCAWFPFHSIRLMTSLRIHRRFVQKSRLFSTYTAYGQNEPNEVLERVLASLRIHPSFCPKVPASFHSAAKWAFGIGMNSELVAIEHQSPSTKRSRTSFSA